MGWQTALTAPWTAPPVTSVSQRTMRCPRMLSNTAQSQLKEAVPSWFELRWCRDKRRRLWRGTLSERQITTLPRKATTSISLTASALHGGRLKQTCYGLSEMCSFATNGSGCVENEVCCAEVARFGLSRLHGAAGKLRAELGKPILNNYQM